MKAPTMHIKIRYRPDDTEWTPWFAWHPVKVGPGEWLWLGQVERKGSWQVTCVSGGETWQWDYRMPDHLKAEMEAAAYDAAWDTAIDDFLAALAAQDKEQDA